MKIGIVNDLPLAREALRRVVAARGHDVIWLAGNGAEAVDLASRQKADLVLMDLVMPGVDGAEATRRIMAQSPCPVLVVTSSVSGHLCKVYEAMGHGALDAVDTPSLGPGGEITGAAHLLDKIATIERLQGLSRVNAHHSCPARPECPRTSNDLLVVIGSSTGGPSALAEVLDDVPRNWPASVIVIQHVDAAFAEGLGNWLAERSGLRVELAREGQRPEVGKVHLAGTNDHLVIDCEGRFRYTDQPREMSFRPSVDVCFQSLAAHWHVPGVAVLLTGMGRDGAQGMLALRRKGWATIAQDQSTSVIWGMPRAAVENGGAARVLPVSEIGAAVVNEVGLRVRNERATS
ncbi:MAG: chemotaxis-specific protein-glutamate methyltransferase CheB [Isosphaeraceae bacterium]